MSMITHIDGVALITQYQYNYHRSPRCTNILQIGYLIRTMAKPLDAKDSGCCNALITFSSYNGAKLSCPNVNPADPVFPFETESY